MRHGSEGRADNRKGANEVRFPSNYKLKIKAPTTRVSAFILERVMGICLGTPVPIASLSLVAASHEQSTGLFVIAPCSIPINTTKKEAVPKGTTSFWSG